MAFVPNREVHEKQSQEIIGSNRRQFHQNQLWKPVCHVRHVQQAEHLLKEKVQITQRHWQILSEQQSKENCVLQYLDTHLNTPFCRNIRHLAAPLVSVGLDTCIPVDLWTIPQPCDVMRNKWAWAVRTLTPHIKQCLLYTCSLAAKRDDCQGPGCAGLAQACSSPLCAFKKGPSGHASN